MSSAGAALPRFQVGDKVEFETAVISPERARWIFDLDQGGSGVWAQGVVCDVTDELIQVKYWIDGCIGEGYEDFPNYGHFLFTFGQWGRPGFLRLSHQQVSAIICECGAHKTYGPSCKLHSDWCPLYNS